MSPGGSDRLRAVVEAAVSAAGYDLEEITVSSAGRRRQVRVVIDRDGGVDLDAAAELSRNLSEQIDELEAAGGAPELAGEQSYTLEVTSPGIGRPLTAPRHFRRAAGRLVRLTLTDGSIVEARAHSSDDVAVHLLTGRSGLDPLSIQHSRIAQARVEVEFNSPSPAITAALAAPFAGPGPGPGPGSGTDTDPDTDTDTDTDTAPFTQDRSGSVHQEADPR